jgi:hypothetical protein
VTQEALTNIVRHAHARSGHVELTLEATRAVLTITDDGVGFDAERMRRDPTPNGVGLLGMRERVAYHRGWIDIRSRPRAGVSITLSIPIFAEPRRSLGWMGYTYPAAPACRLRPFARTTDAPFSLSPQTRDEVSGLIKALRCAPGSGEPRRGGP